MLVHPQRLKQLQQVFGSVDHGKTAALDAQGVEDLDEEVDAT